MTKPDIRTGKAGRGLKYPEIEGYEVIPAWSRGRKPWKSLSPFIVGPLRVEEPLIGEEPFPGFKVSKKDKNVTYSIVNFFEQYWQESKIYKIDLKNPDKPPTLKNLKPSFFERRAAGFKMEKARRRSLPKAKYGTPIAGFYEGEVMDYISARKRIYCHYYASMIEDDEVFLELVNKVENGENLIIVGPDGISSDIELTEEKLMELIDNPAVIFGHELVIASMLLGFRVWEE